VRIHNVTNKQTNKQTNFTAYHNENLSLEKVYKNHLKKVKFTVEQATKAQRGSRGLAHLFV